MIKNDMSRTNDIRRTRSGQKTMSAKPDTVKTITGQKNGRKKISKESQASVKQCRKDQNWLRAENDVMRTKNNVERSIHGQKLMS